MDNNVDNTIKSNVGLYNYFDADRISSGDIGIQNRNAGGYGNSIYGGDGTDGKNGPTEPSRRLIPMITQGANNRICGATIEPIRTPNNKSTTEKYTNMIEDIDSDDLHRIDYIERERFSFKDGAYSVLLIIVIIIIVMVIALYFMFDKIKQLMSKLKHAILGTMA